MENIEAFSYCNGPITNTVPTSTCNLTQVHKFVTTNKHLEELTHRIRAMPPGKERDKEKCTLPYCVFTGKVTRRNDACMVRPSFLACVDLDDTESEQAGKELARCLFNDEKLKPRLMFNSISWGVKLVIDVEFDPLISYKDCMMSTLNYAWAYIEATYGSKFQFKIDRGASALSQACFLCHDENAKLRVI